MKKNAMTLALTAALVVTMVTPQVATAGNKEWATAGKILAGVTAYHVLSDGGRGHHQSVRVEEHYTYRDTHRPPSYPVYYGSSYGCGSPRSYQYSSVSHYYEDLCGGCRHPRPSCTCGPVIIQISECRRLYQPRIRGHVSYLQEWDECRREWCTIGIRDSIW